MEIEYCARDSQKDRERKKDREKQGEILKGKEVVASSMLIGIDETILINPQALECLFLTITFSI